MIWLTRSAGVRAGVIQSAVSVEGRIATASGAVSGSAQSRPHDSRADQVHHRIGFRDGHCSRPRIASRLDVVAFITKDMTEIRVDEYVYMNRLTRYRFSLAHELAHRILHPDLWKEIDFDDIQSWKGVTEESIPEREYSFIEFHANVFAGLVLVPSPELRKQFVECIELTKQHGLDASDEATGAKDVIESNIARHFEVSSFIAESKQTTFGTKSKLYRGIEPCRSAQTTFKTRYLGSAVT